MEKIPLWIHFKQKQVGKGREIEKKKIVVPFLADAKQKIPKKKEKNLKKL